MALVELHLREPKTAHSDEDGGGIMKFSDLPTWTTFVSGRHKINYVKIDQSRALQINTKSLKLEEIVDFYSFDNVQISDLQFEITNGQIYLKKTIFTADTIPIGEWFIFKNDNLSDRCYKSSKDSFLKVSSSGNFEKIELVLYYKSEEVIVIPQQVVIFIPPDGAKLIGMDQLKEILSKSEK